MSVDVTTKFEPEVIEESKTAVVVISSEQILTVIEQQHACYDYCAAWKEPVPVEDRADQQDEAPDVAEIQR